MRTALSFLALLSATAAAQAPAQVVVYETAPAEAPARDAQTQKVEYAYDDGAANVNIGPPSTFDPDMLWGNYFATQPGGEVITEIAVAFGATFPSLATGPVTLWLLDDPDADGDPRNATSRASVQVTPTVFGNTFVRVPIPQTAVGAAFFVGASARLLGGQDRPARVDTGARADRSWFFYAPDIPAVIDALATAPFGTRMDDPDTVPFPGAFMVRAAGEPAGTTTADETPSDLPALLGVWPNPAAGDADVRVRLPLPADIDVRVFDALGRHVTTLAEGPHEAGTHLLRWSDAAAPPGVYAVRLRAGPVQQSLRLVRAR